jgi:hypothetical protein
MMKKQKVIPGWLFMVGLALSTPGSFASNIHDVTPKSKSILNLRQRFPDATDVIWREERNTFTAYYTIRGEKAISHFREDGSLDFTLLYLKKEELPIPIYVAIKKKYKGFKVTNVEEYLSKGADYYAVLIESKTALISLKTDNNNNIEVLQELKKS